MIKRFKRWLIIRRMRRKFERGEYSIQDLVMMIVFSVVDVEIKKALKKVLTDEVKRKDS